MLIDGGSSIDVPFFITSYRIRLSEELISRAEGPLIGFNGNPSFPKGNIVLPVTAIEKLLQVNFVVVEAKLAYNVILGRGWIHRMERGTSTLYQVFRCQATYGITMVKIRGDQTSAKRCIITTDKFAKKKSKSQMPDEESTPM